MSAASTLDEDVEMESELALIPDSDASRLEDELDKLREEA